MCTIRLLRKRCAFLLFSTSHTKRSFSRTKVLCIICAVLFFFPFSLVHKLLEPFIWSR